MALKRFGNILKDTSEKLRNKMTDSIKNDVADLRNEEFKKQQADNRQKADNQMAWDNYKRQGGKIDFPEFDAKIVDLPKEDENEKEIKIDRTPPKVASTSIRPPNTQIYDLDALAGNGIPVKEQPEPVVEEPSVSDTTISDDNTIAEPSVDENPELADFDESEVVEPEDNETGVSAAEAGDNPTQYPSDDEINDMNKTIVDEEGKNDPVADVDDEGNVIPPENNENKEGEENKEGGENKNLEPPPENKEGGENKEKKPTEGEGDEDEPEDEKPVKTANGNGPINDDTDLVKKGSGVSINDIVDRSQIPHYDYLSFFR